MLSVSKNNVSLKIPETVSTSIKQWLTNNYTSWENSTFNILNKFVSNEKIFIDIGSWIGCLSLPYNTKFKHVIAVEADKLSVIDFQKLIDANSIDNITIIHRAIYSKSDETVTFGSNKFRTDFGLNESMSQIKETPTNTTDYTITTISLRDLISEITDQIAILKIDIEGGEENILEDILWAIELKIPVLLSFHYTWITNKTAVDRFSEQINRLGINMKDDSYNDITITLQEYLRQQPFGSILFETR
jgi:FkbM family methyltransferase